MYYIYIFILLYILLYLYIYINISSTPNGVVVFPPTLPYCKEDILGYTLRNFFALVHSKSTIVLFKSILGFTLSTKTPSRALRLVV